MNPFDKSCLFVITAVKNILSDESYTGLLTCGDCGTTFVPRIRTWNRNSRVEQEIDDILMEKIQNGE